MDHEHTDYAVCPHCGYADHDSWELDLGPGLEGDGETSCASCGEDFFVSRNVTVTYSTKAIARAAIKKVTD